MAPANAFQPARPWRLVITRLSSLLAISLLLSLYAPLRAQTPPPVDGGWPRDTTTPSGARLIIYQPQIASWTGQIDLVAYAAVSYTPGGVQKAAPGTITLKSQTNVSTAQRLISFADLQITNTNFPTLERDQVRVFLADLEYSLPLNDRVMATSGPTRSGQRTTRPG
jgi:hypothetical protein